MSLYGVLLYVLFSIISVLADFTELDAFGARNSRGIAWVDFNNDGRLDVVVSNNGNTNDTTQRTVLYLQESDNTFTEHIVLGVPGNIRGISCGDYNNDRFSDIAMATTEGIRIFRNDSETGMTQIDLGSGIFLEVAWGDHDNDGDLDLAASSGTSPGNVNTLFQNEGADIFTTLTPFDSTKSDAVSWGDYDKDGDLDIAFSNFNGETIVFKNNANTQFYKILLEPVVNGQSIAWGDLDNDADLDLLVGVSMDFSLLYENKGSSEFAVLKPFKVQIMGSVSLGDYDLDGDLDIAAMYALSDTPNRLFQNGSDFLFVGSDAFGNGASKGAACADYDNDGDLDLAVANYMEQNKLYRNDINSNNYIKVRCIGRAMEGYSNRDAIGAQITLQEKETNALAGYREVCAGSGMSSMNSLYALFGALTSKPYTVIVHWPVSGLTDTVPHVQPPADITVEEGMPTHINNHCIKTALETDNPYMIVRQHSKSFVTIEYSTGNTAPVALSFYSLSGACVRSFRLQPQNHHGTGALVWDYTSVNGIKAASGIYLCCLKSGNTVMTKSIVNLR